MKNICTRLLLPKIKTPIKTNRAMKLTCALLLTASMGVFATGNAQTMRVNIQADNVSTGKILSEIEKQTDYLFVYNKKEVDLKRKTSVNAVNKTTAEVLSTIFNGTDIIYAIEGENIMLMRKEQNLAVVPDAVQQDNKITGTVLDATGMPVIGANIMVKGTTNGTITDMDGKFSLEAREGAVLVVSYIGFANQEIKIGKQKQLSIALKEDSQALDELVVVGYGTQKKTHLTGSVEVVDSKDLENRPVTSASALLQGQVAGMTFTTPGGGNVPGSNMTLQIRGQAALSGETPPLVVIDGIPSEMADFNALNPNDIESVSVLKDAAATAVYGARAPYGVLMVKTKMGKRGEKVSINYSGNYGVVNPVRMPNMTDSYTFALMKNQAMLNSRYPAHFSDEKLDLILDNIQNPGKYTSADLNPGEGNTWGWGNNSYENNDFIDIWLRPSFRHQHDLSVRGGSEKTSFFVSSGYVYQPGVFEFVEDIDNYSRFNINGGIESDITNWLKVTYRSRYSYSTMKEPCFEYNWGRSSVYDFAYGAWPVTPIKNPDGTYNEGNRIATGLGAGNRTDIQHRLDNILAFDLNLAKGWTVHVDGTWRMFFKDYQTFRKPVYGLRPSGDQFLLGGTESSLAKSTDMNRYWTVQGYTAYEHSIKDHFFRVQIGAQAEESIYRQLSGTAKDLFNTDMDAVSIAQGDRTFDDAISDWATAGFFGRINYNYKERYLLELNGRYDGSGRYARGQRWGFFPSASIGWNMSNESFWESLKDIFNFSKLRMSYGTLGNQGNSPGYIHIPTMSVGSQAPWIINGVRYPYVNTPGILNMQRTWEKITTLDIGLELKTLNNRLSAEIEYFNRKSWDIIGPATPKPSVLGASAPEVNNAEFVTNGWELQMNWRDMINDNWDYSVGLTLSDAMSEITKYNTTTNSIGGWYVGKKFGEIWGYETDGLLTKDDFNSDGTLKVDQSEINANWYPGDVKYVDLNHDGKISKGTDRVEDSGDKRIIGNSTPRYRYGINLATGYTMEKAGRLDLSLFFEGVAKCDWFMNSSYFYWGAGNGNSYSVSIYEGEHMDFYRDETSAPRLIEHMGIKTDAFWPRPYDSAEGYKNFETNTRYLINAAYLRLKNMQIAYTLPSSLLSKLKISNCRVYFSGENLFVLSKLPSYMDPEAVGGGRMYPQQAVYSFGVNLGF